MRGEQQFNSAPPGGWLPGLQTHTVQQDQGVLWLYLPCFWQLSCMNVPGKGWVELWVEVGATKRMHSDTSISCVQPSSCHAMRMKKTHAGLLADVLMVT